MTRTVLITGAAGGIGRATVALFHQRSWRVIGVDRNEFGAGYPAEGVFIRSDISRPEDMQAIFEQVHCPRHRLDALVNNAAMQIAKPLVDTTAEEWDAVMASNLGRSSWPQSWLTRCWQSSGGAIVNVSSVHAIQTSANIAAYAASKGGLAGADPCHGHRICTQQHPGQCHPAGGSRHAHAPRRARSWSRSRDPMCRNALKTLPGGP